MALITSSDTLDTEFTPAAGDFIAQVSGNSAANLLRKDVSGAAFVLVGTIMGEAKVISNPVGGAIYKWTAVYPASAPTVRADQ